MWAGRLYQPHNPGDQVPTSLPAKGRIEVVRYVRSNRIVDLFGNRLTLAEEHTHQHVTAIIKLRAKQVVIIDGEVVHDGSFVVTGSLRRNRNDVMPSHGLHHRNDVQQTPHLPNRRNDVLPVKR